MYDYNSGYKGRGEREGNQTYIDRDVDADAVVLSPPAHVVVPLLRLVVADHQRPLRQILEETFRLRPVDEEVERLGDGAQGQEGEEGPHCCRSLVFFFYTLKVAWVGRYPFDLPRWD